MTKKVIAASSQVYLTADDLATELHVYQLARSGDEIVDSTISKHPYNPLDVMTASLAACSAMGARSFLELDGDPGDIRVTVSLDTASPPRLHRRVEISRQLSRAKTRRFTQALQGTEITVLLRAIFKIHTVIEHADGASSNHMS